jgi:hypothetical protein
MAVRETMANLITRVRDMVNDPAGDTQKFSDQQIQDVLDRHRIDFRYLELTPGITISGGTTGYLNYYADEGDWEEDVVISSSTGAAVSPATSDYLTGAWTFASSQYPPLFLTGKSYDPHASAAEVLRMWASREKLSFDASQGGTSAQRSQKIKHLREMASEYDGMAKIRSVQIIRTDVSTTPIGRREYGDNGLPLQR